MPRRPSTTGEVLRLIREEGVTTRADLGRLTGLSRPAVAARIAELMEYGLVTEHADGHSTGGRPPLRLEFNAAGAVVVVASLGHTHGHLAVCDLAGGILAIRPTEISPAASPRQAVDDLVEAWRDLLATADRGIGDVRGAGIAIPGAVEFATGQARDMLTQWNGVDVRPLVADRISAPVFLDNDVNVMALGEHHFRRRETAGADDLLFVKFSTGIGAGVIAGGRLQRGALGAAGEIGHIPVHDADDLLCRCGNRGCLETVAGGARLLAQVEGVDDLAKLAALAQAGDPAVVGLVREAGRQIGEVLASAVNLLNPAVVVLGGDLAAASEPLIAGVREVVYSRSTALSTRDLQIEPSRLGDTAGILGCATLVLDNILAPATIDALPPTLPAR